MTIGGSIALIAIGAILAFAVDFDVAGINIAVIGIILMAAGLIGLIFGLVQQRRVTTTTNRPVVEERRVVDDRDVY